MIRSTSEILRQLKTGEDSTIRFRDLKYTGNQVNSQHSDSIADDLAAMSNTIGGIIVFGIDFITKTIIGIPDDKIEIVESWINQISKESINPQLYCTIHKSLVPTNDDVEKEILIVEVPKTVFVHESPSGYYQCMGSRNRKMTQITLAGLLQQRERENAFFDWNPVPNATNKDLNSKLLKKFKTIYTPEDDFELLTKLNLLTENESGKISPSVTGILMLSNHPHDFLPNAFIKAVCYRGKEENVNYVIDSKDIHGPLDVQIECVFKFVKKNMKYHVIEGREDIPQYSMLAVFEAIANAVAHRDYSVYGSNIRLHMFNDRLELYSPGSLIGNIKIENFPHLLFSRNQLITSLLGRCPLPRIDLRTKRRRIMDLRGEGVPVILSESEKLSGKPPEYRYLDESEVMLTIFGADSPQRNEY